MPIWLDIMLSGEGFHVMKSWNAAGVEIIVDLMFAVAVRPTRAVIRDHRWLVFEDIKKCLGVKHRGTLQSRGFGFEVHDKRKDITFW